MRTDGQNTHKIFPAEVIQELKIPFPKIRVVGVIVWGKHNRAGQATDGHMMTHELFILDNQVQTQYVIILLLHGNNGYSNAPQVTLMRKLPALLHLT